MKKLNRNVTDNINQLVKDALSSYRLTQVEFETLLATMEILHRLPESNQTDRITIKEIATNLVSKLEG